MGLPGHRAYPGLLAEQQLPDTQCMSAESRRPLAAHRPLH
jgi:hypothetical protein